MNVDKQNLAMSEAARRFLASLSPERGAMSQQEVYQFVRWFGWERPMAQVRPPEVANYARRLSLSDPNYVNKFEAIRAFLIYAGKEGWCQSNLAAHFKTKGGKARSLGQRGADLPGAVSLTRRGYDELEAELNDLRSRRSRVIGEVRRAAADKDFRENAPLEAAREEHGRLEGRIRGLEKVLGAAVIIDGKRGVAHKVNIGDRLLLRDEASGEELRYMIVSPREVDPIKGRISSVSPIGKAVLGRVQGDIIEVDAPAGKLRYQIKDIER